MRAPACLICIIDKNWNAAYNCCQSSFHDRHEQVGQFLIQWPMFRIHFGFKWQAPAWIIVRHWTLPAEKLATALRKLLSRPSFVSRLVCATVATFPLNRQTYFAGKLCVQLLAIQICYFLLMEITRTWLVVRDWTQLEKIVNCQSCFRHQSRLVNDANWICRLFNQALHFSNHATW